MAGTSLTTMKFCDLPKPFFQLLVHSIDANTKHRLRSACRDTLSLVDEFCSVSLCIRGRDILPKRALAYGQLSRSISRLCVADCVKDGLFREAVCVQSAFSQLSHVVINYRLSTTTRHLASAAGSNLHSITIVSGRRKGSRWNFKYCRTLGTLQHLKTLSHLHLTLHTTRQSAQQLGLLTQIQSLNLSLLCSSGSSSSSGGGWDDDQGSKRRELMFQPEFWDLGVAPLTGLTSLQMCVPLVVKRDVGLPNIPQNLHSLSLQLLPVDNNLNNSSDYVNNSKVSGVTAAQQILHNLPDMMHLTRLVIHEDTQNDWINASEKQITAQGAENLGRLSQLRVLDLSVGHWKVNLEQLQPLSGLCNLTELIVPELVMGYGDEGIDDQLGSRLSKEEAAAVAAAMAAAAAAAGSSASRSWQQQANVQGYSGRTSRGSAGSSRHYPNLAAAAAAVPRSSSRMCTSPTADSSSSSSNSVIKINGSNYVVPLLPQLKVLRCSTLWWRLPLVVLAPALQDVKYKRLRNLGYGSFVLPDLTDWEEEQTLPAEFEQMLQQQGNAFNNILAPQGGFNLNNPAAAAAAAADQAAAAAAVEAAAEAVAAAAAAAEHGAQVGLVGPLEELVHELQDWQEHWQQQQHWQQWQQQVGQQQQQEQPAIVLHDQVPQGEGNALVQDPAAAAAAAAAGDQAAAGAAGDQAAAGAAEPAAAAAGGAAGGAAGIFAAVAAAEAAVAAVEQAVMHVNHQQQQLQPPPPPPPLLPQFLPPTAAAASAPAPHIAINIGPAAPPPALPGSNSSSVTPQPLQIAPASKCYGDVLRGQLCLRSLDVCVTSLCKIMRLSSLSLVGLERLQLHMLGEVMLAPGGLPTLAALTHLEFYLPDERNWDANYNDYEDIALWQHQHNVTNIVIKGTYHAGGFFAPGHWDIARQCMPHLQTVRFVRCKDMHVDKLQVVVDSKAAKVVEFCDWSNVDSQDGEDQDLAAAAASSSDSGSEAASATHAAAAADHDDDTSQQHPKSSPSDVSFDTSSLSMPDWHGSDNSSSSSSSNAHGSSADLQGPQDLGDGMAVNPQFQELGQDIGPPPLQQPELGQQQQPLFLVGLLHGVTAGSSSGGSSAGLVDRAAVLQMAVAAADSGVEVRWVSQQPAWKALLD